MPGTLHTMRVREGKILVLLSPLLSFRYQCSSAQANHHCKEHAILAQNIMCVQGLCEPVCPFQSSHGYSFTHTVSQNVHLGFFLTDFGPDNRGSIPKFKDL